MTVRPGGIVVEGRDATGLVGAMPSFTFV